MISIWTIIAIVGMVGPLYAITMVLISAGKGLTRPEQRHDYDVICLVPCLNEGVVVRNTVQGLLTLSPEAGVLVIDDASDDETPDILDGFVRQRFRSIRREFPEARVGKGAALNDAYHQVRVVGREIGVDPTRVILAVFDGDGYADPATLRAAIAWFEDPDVGGVQIGVRINNRDKSMLARMQDVEFCTYTQIFQRARNRITSTGLGGNGQFVRLSALETLGDRPWSDSLTEDLDLGIRLRLNGWRTVFDGSVSVHQQGLHQMSRLIRQRTRWFQGHLQAWSHLGPIVRSGISLRAKIDMLVHLVMPVLMLGLSIGIMASLVGLVRLLVLAPTSTLAELSKGPAIPLWYLLGFLAGPLVASAYWRAERSVGFFRGMLYAHLYTLFTWIWFPAGVRAVWREFRAAQGWAKTDRVAEDGADEEGEHEPAVVSAEGADEIDPHAIDRQLVGSQR